MKKRGFTLAEVLITLGIIGVVAALTAPSLVMNSRNESNAAKLAVTMSNLENAFTNAIVQEDVDDLCKTSIWVTKIGEISMDTSNGAQSQTTINDAALVGNLNKYIHLNGYEKMGNASSFYSGTAWYKMNKVGGKGAVATADGTLGNVITIYTKSGAVLFLDPKISGEGPKGDAKTQDQIAALGGSLNKKAADLYIDVNGKTSPNTYGRDIFAFYVGTNGILYPYGGLDVSIFDKGNASAVWNATGKDGSSSGGDASCMDGAIGNGLGCTARLIAESYKMNY